MTELVPLRFKLPAEELITCTVFALRSLLWKREEFKGQPVGKLVLVVHDVLGVNI